MAKGKKVEAPAAGKPPHMAKVMHGDTAVFANSTKKGEYRCTKCGQTGHPLAKS